MLTDPAFIRKLDGLYLLARKVLGGSLQSDRKSTKKGAGITFADYAEYHLGDDFRSIDWRVYARFEQLVVKLFEIDEDATVYILLDESHSMKSKFLFARQLGAALGYIALVRSNNFAVRSMGIAAVIGEVTCLFAAILVLPATLIWMDRRKRNL